MSILQKVDLLYETSQNKIAMQQNELYFQKLKDALQQKGIQFDDIEKEINDFASSISLLYCKIGIQLGSTMFSDEYFIEH